MRWASCRFIRCCEAPPPAASAPGSTLARLSPPRNPRRERCAQPVRRRGEAILRAILAVLVASFVLAGPRPALSEDAAAAEAEYRTIEALIASVAQLSDATFLRNGKSYPAATAARFLREKWQSRQSEVRSAEEFIDRIASFSSTTSEAVSHPFRRRTADLQRRVSSRGARKTAGESAVTCRRGGQAQRRKTGIDSQPRIVVEVAAIFAFS